MSCPGGYAGGGSEEPAASMDARFRHLENQMGLFIEHKTQMEKQMTLTNRRFEEQETKMAALREEVTDLRAQIVLKDQIIAEQTEIIRRLEEKLQLAENEGMKAGDEQVKRHRDILAKASSDREELMQRLAQQEAINKTQDLRLAAKDEEIRKLEEAIEELRLKKADAERKEQMAFTRSKELEDQSKGTNYRRVNPRAELSRPPFTLTAESVNRRQEPKLNIPFAWAIPQENDDCEQKVGTPYKRIDQQAEIMAAKRMSANDNSMLTKVSTGYKRVDRKAEIEAAISSSVDNVYGQHQVASLYQRTDAAAEINLSRRLTGAQLTSDPAPSPTRTPVTPPSPNLGITAIALYDYEACESDELSLAFGEQLIRIDMIDEGWWVGENGSGRRGMFPANYVELN